MSQVKVTTRQYENAHGRKPKGFGLWAFEIVDDSNGQVATTLWITANYGEAKKEAIQEVRENWADELATGYLSLNVGS